MARRTFSREFKVESVRLVQERGVSVAQAARDLELHENKLRRWTKELAADPAQAFPGHGQERPDRAEELTATARTSFVGSARTYGARRVWRDLLADGVSCGLHKGERLMRANAQRARPRRRRLPKDAGQACPTPAANVLDRQCSAERPNQKWIADFTYIWTAEGWLYVAAVIDLFSWPVWSAGP